MKNCILVALISCSMLVACSGSEDTTTTVDVGETKNALMGKVSETPKSPTLLEQDTLPLPDPNKPLTAYSETNSGAQLGYQYHALSDEPFDHALFASRTVREYMLERDEFAKNDIVEKARDRMDQGVAQAKVNRYHWMSVGTSSVLLDPYDFQRKGFPVNEFTQIGDRTFNDARNYALRWVNGDQVAFAPVPDQAVAREIEEYRSGRRSVGLESSKPLLKIYYYVQSVTPQESQFTSNYINAVITHVQITASDGRVLAEYSPDNAVEVSRPESNECQGTIADCIGMEF